MTDKKNSNVIVQKTFQFSLKTILYTSQLKEAQHFVIANQLTRSGTSIGAMVREAQHAESRKDFIHKMKIAAKEADETSYWLELCMALPGYPDCAALMALCQEISRMLSKIIFTAKQRLSE
ncbi:MAG: four helix bundle protein [Chitinophagaceae bacterium]|nr:four helix bundle protein [Chitinophagaceae bacterium]